VPLSKAWLEGYLDKLEDCDVYQRHSFLTGLVVTNTKAGQTITPECSAYLQSLGNQWLEVRAEEDLADLLAPGPYLYLDKALKPVYRLQDDEQRAFLTALKPG
jgi:hypothetical protein